jgi:hypothetical protein
MRLPALLASALVGSIALATAGAAEAQTVQQVAAQGMCSTAGVSQLSDQLVQVQMCISPGTFVAFTPHAGVTLTSAQIHPYLLATSRDALWTAAASVPLQVNSAFRTLADQYVLYYSGGCSLAAMPGNSNHETGRAVDLENWSAALSAMEAAGCTHSYPTTDPVHFDCPGTDHRSDSILAFQQLWNANNPGDVIAEDGQYGPETESRLASSPADGFATVPGCAPATPDAGSDVGGEAGLDDAQIDDAGANDAKDAAIASDASDVSVVGDGSSAGCACETASSTRSPGGLAAIASALLGAALVTRRARTRH